MGLLKKMRKVFNRSDKQLSSMAGVIFGAQPPIGVRKKNAEYLAIRDGVRRTEARRGVKKSRKQLRREKDAMWLGNVLEKRYAKSCAKETV